MAKDTRRSSAGGAEPEGALAGVEAFGRMLEGIDRDDLMYLAVVRGIMAENDLDFLGSVAAITVQREEELGPDPELATRRVMEGLFRASKRIAEHGLRDTEEYALEAESTVSAFTGEPLVRIVHMARQGHYPPNIARAHAYAILEAAESSELDAAFYAIALEDGASEEDANRSVARFQAKRAEYQARVGRDPRYRDQR